jgi:hypothetical protein
MARNRDLSKLLSTANGKIGGSNLDVSFENISDTGNEGTKVASGTTAQRGSTTGQYRFNSTTGFFEGYNGSSFVSLAPTPTISSVSPTEVASQAGGNVDIVIQGTNFDTGTTVSFVGNDGTSFNASSVALNSSIQVTATVAKNSFVNSKEPYDVKLTASSGLQATQEDSINVDNLPTWSTASGGLGGGFEGDSYSFTVSATDPDGDTVAYSLQSGSLPSGGSLNSSTGAITGTHPSVSSNTTHTFTIRATAGGKTSDREFSILTVNPTTNIYTSSGNFTLASAQAVKIYAIGGGGGGGSTFSGSSGGAGGGGGGMAYKLFSNVPAGTYSYTVGGKGASNSAGSNGTGSAGGTSSITIGGVTLQATGGAGGTAWVSTSQAGTGGAGGVGSGGDINGTGGAGANGIAESNPSGTIYNGIDGSDGTNGGAGGGGGGTDLGSGNSQSQKAGDGGDGSSTYYTGGGGGAGWDNDGQTAYQSQRGLGGTGYASGGEGGNMLISSEDGGGNAGGSRGSSGSTRNTYGGGGGSYGGGGGGSGSGDGGQYPEAGEGGGGAIVIIS